MARAGYDPSSPNALAVLAAARDLVDRGGEPSMRNIAAASGRSESTVGRHRQHLRRRGLWPWPDVIQGVRPSTMTSHGYNSDCDAARRLLAAAPGLAASGPVSLARLVAATGLSLDTVGRHRTALKRLGLWSYPDAPRNAGRKPGRTPYANRGGRRDPEPEPAAPVKTIPITPVSGSPAVACRRYLAEWRAYRRAVRMEVTR